MTNRQSCLSATALFQLAHGEILPDELHNIEDHVTECERCRQSVNRVVDDPQWTKGIFPVLNMPVEAAPTYDEQDEFASNESILQLLGPTDDPHMLGRIGSYEIMGIIGRGGMGIVFKAFDASLDRFVAIKMLLPHLAASGAARKRFSREAQAAAAVIDDHVLPIYGVDEWQGIPYLVTQYSRGMTLQKRIHEQGPLDLKEILRIGLQTARGLTAAHAQGLVHRDVKPSNILLDGTVERALLMDFGLARAADDASVTRTGMVAGTPQYMSPEQVRGELVDARSDLFSLGSTLYAMCTGRSPFRAESTYSVMHRITEGGPSPIQEINPDIPKWLCDVIAKLMSNQTDDRFESAHELAELLEDCLAHVQQPTTVPLPKLCRESRNEFSPSRREKATAAMRSPLRRGLLLLTFGFALCLAGVLIVLEAGKGKLTIESEADDVPIRITQDGEVVKRLTVNRTGAGVRVAAGEYRVEIDGTIDGLAVDNGNTVTLERRREEIVRIVYATRSPEGEPDEAASGADNQGGVDLKDQATPNGLSGVYVLQVSPSKGETKLDLDRGEKFGPIVGPGTEDLSFPMSGDTPSRNVFAINSIVSAVSEEDPWSLSLENIRDRLALEKRVPARQLAGPQDELPRFFAFQTDAGAVGVLSVDEIDPDTGETTIRYRIRIVNKGTVDFTQPSGRGTANDSDPGASTHDRREVSTDHAPRHFVRIVVGREKLSFEGMETTWEELPRRLEEIQNREETVLEVAIASEQLTLAEVGVARGRAQVLARQYRFQYSSYVGVHQPEVDGGAANTIQTVVTQIQNLEEALEVYRLDNGTYPPTKEGLTPLVEKPADEIRTESWNGPYVEALPTDPWGNAYVYVFPGVRGGDRTRPNIWSLGPDGTDNTDDDIGSWAKKPTTEKNIGHGTREGQVPTPDSLLTVLQEYDQTMEAGFTVEGTKIDIPGRKAGGNLPPTRRTWKLSMAPGKFGYDAKIQEVLRWQDIVGPDGVAPARDEKPDFAFDLRQKIFLNQEILADYCYFAAEAIFEPGKVAPPTDDNPGLARSASLTTHPASEANRYGFKNDPLWAMGRGYSPFIRRLTAIKQLADGRLVVTALGKEKSPIRWELLIDPKAGYLVREAKYIWSDEDPPGFVITTFGTQWIGTVSIPQSYKLLEDTGYGDVVNSKVGGTFTSGKASADTEFLKGMESILTPPYPLPTQVVND